MKTPLASRDCVACGPGTPRLGAEAIEELRAEVPNWEVSSGERLVREFRHPDFAAAWALLDRIAALAEAQSHHPELQLGWGRLRVELWTHAIGGLSESDFVLAAKIDRLAGA